MSGDVTDQAEAFRLRVLADYAVDQAGDDETLAQIVSIAATICEAPIALVSLVDATHQRFVARRGLAATETTRDIAFCAHAIASGDEMFTVEDARRDPRFVDNPLVTDDPSVVFYVGVPLSIEDAKLGTLCVIDRVPRELNEVQREALRRLAALVVDHLRARKIARDRAAFDAFSRTVLTSIGDAVVAVDASSRITFFNQAAERITSWERTHALGRPLDQVFRIVDEETNASIDDPVAQVLRGGSTRTLPANVALITKTGRLVPIEGSAAPVRLVSGSLVGAVFAFRDASHARAAAKERADLLAQAQAAETHARAERRQLFETFMRAPVAIAILEGPDHRFTFANPMYRALANGGEIIGRPLVTVLPESADETLPVILARVKDTGETLHLMERSKPMRPGREDPQFLNFTFAPLANRQGVVDGVIVSAVDVTDQVLARQRARSIASEEIEARAAAESALERSDFLLEIAAAVGSGLDRERLVRRLLQAIVPHRADFASLWHVETDGRLRREAHAPWTEDLDRADALAAQKYGDDFPIQRVVNNGQAMVLNDFDGWMREHASPEHQAIARQLDLHAGLYLPITRGGVVTGVLAISRRDEAFTLEDRALFTGVAEHLSVSLENAHLYAEVERLREAAERATQAKDQFLARVSHDLRNPLGSILGWSTLLRQGQLDAAKTKRAHDIIERSAQAQVQLIEDLLDVSRIREGKLKLDLSSESLQKAIEEALDPARIAAETKGVRLDVEVDAEAGFVVIDPTRFRQVVWNLASNAVKFTPAGSWVRVESHRSGSHFEVVVSDGGRGIAPAFLPRVFGSFEQAESGTLRSGGLGLGLAIARHIVELHGGTLDVTSEGEGKGATFTARFPIRATAWATTSEAPVAPPEGSDLLRGVTVLAVDDEDASRDVVRAMLESAGARVVSAGSVTEAMLLLQDERPDVLVSDLTMPDEDGHDLVRRVRALPEAEGGRTPAVALSAMARSRDRVQAVSAGFNTHVPKPVDRDELVMMVAGLLGISGPKDAGPSS